MLNKVQKDFKAYIFLKPFEIYMYIYIYVCSRYTFFLAHLKGITIEDIPCCNGVPFFMRCPNSTIKIGKKISINSSFKSNNIGVFSRSRITTNSQEATIEIGEHVGMTSVTISAFKKITIGNHTLIGGNVLITDSDWHPIDPELRRKHLHQNIGMTEVVIGENVFIGTRSIILKGSTIGNNSVIGAGSVVSGEIPANVIACGNPCRTIKKI